MKKILLLSATLFLGCVAMAQTKTATTATTTEATTSKAKIEFADKSKDFGDIFQGDKVSHVFKFKNTGTEPLVLSNVITSCGCTATQWPKEPIAPGAEAEINATFNSAGKMGKQNKVITVVSNSSEGSARVSIISNVLPKKTTVTPPAPAQK